MFKNLIKRLRNKIIFIFILGKEWGSPDGEPTIALHGWLDNCGSFDKLLPHYPDNHRIIAIDIPGHGFSSHIPLGFSYHHLDGLQYIRRVADYYNFDKFNLLGHSMGGGMCFVYAVTHPEHVQRLIVLDAIKPVSRLEDLLLHMCIAHFTNILYCSK